MMSREMLFKFSFSSAGCWIGHVPGDVKVGHVPGDYMFGVSQIWHVGHLPPRYVKTLSPNWYLSSTGGRWPPEAVRLGVVNSLGLPVSDMGDDILSWPGKRGVPEVGRVTDMEGVARGKEVGGVSSEGIPRSCWLGRRWHPVGHYYFNLDMVNLGEVS